jgi:signal transduction histidine kinase/HD-like signal output (HDOD) protein
VGEHQSESGRFRRIELVIQQLESLPTLSAIAVRLLELTADDHSRADDVIRLVASDPSLASKVLKLCRCHERGRASDVSTVERAVLLLGFDAVRSAVLSVEVFELFDGMTSAGGEVRTDRPAFDRLMFWQHSLAVATVSELLVEAGRFRHSMSSGETFIAGLLHDLGQLALHVVLPRSFDRVCELAEAHGITLGAACRKIIGIDPHTVGKRLAEHWQLPEPLRDAVWLSGQPLDSLPDLDHTPMIGVVTLADAIVRRQHIGPLGHGPHGEDVTGMCAQLGLAPEIVDDIIPGLHEEVAARCSILGLDFDHSTDLLLRAIMRANQVLGQLNGTLRQRARIARKQGRTLESIAEFHERIDVGSSVVSVLRQVARSLHGAFGGTTCSILYQPRVAEHWQVFRFTPDGRLLQSAELPQTGRLISPQGETAWTDLARQVMDAMPSLRDTLGDAEVVDRLRMLPLPCGWGVSAVLLHDCPLDDDDLRDQLRALRRTWGAAIAGAAQYERVKALSEQLAESNRELVGAQDSLTKNQTMAALGELAAGAAHEMNNPLTVISGRSQMLATRLADGELRTMAEQIGQQSHRLSDIITALRSFAEPSKPTECEVDVADLVMRVVQQIHPGRRRSTQINSRLAPGLPAAWIDPDQIGCALSELLRNAVESEGVRTVELRVQIDAFDDRLKLQVSDDGGGLSEHALTHAFDPFFSAKSAGRQPGLGLPRARRLVEAHDGQITLENGPQGGAVATIWLSDWREPPRSQRRVA